MLPVTPHADRFSVPTPTDLLQSSFQLSLVVQATLYQASRSCPQTIRVPWLRPIVAQPVLGIDDSSVCNGASGGNVTLSAGLHYISLSVPTPPHQNIPVPDRNVSGVLSCSGNTCSLRVGDNLMWLHRSMSSSPSATDPPILPSDTVASRTHPSSCIAPRRCVLLSLTASLVTDPVLATTSPGLVSLVDPVTPTFNQPQWVAVHSTMADADRVQSLVESLRVQFYHGILRVRPSISWNATFGSVGRNSDLMAAVAASLTATNRSSGVWTHSTHIGLAFESTVVQLDPTGFHNIGENGTSAQTVQWLQSPVTRSVLRVPLHLVQLPESTQPFTLNLPVDTSGAIPSPSSRPHLAKPGASQATGVVWSLVCVALVLSLSAWTAAGYR